MDREKLDEMLAAEEELVPSSGFMAAVMERVQEEAAAPSPIPFPWKRALPGVALFACVLGWGAVEAVRYGAPALRGISFGQVLGAQVHLFASLTRPLEQVGWVTLALGISLVSWMVSRRIAGQSGLL